MQNGCNCLVVGVSVARLLLPASMQRLLLPAVVGVGIVLDSREHRGRGGRGGVLDFWAVRPFETLENDGKITIRIGGIFCLRGAGNAWLDDAETGGFLCEGGGRTSVPIGRLPLSSLLSFSCVSLPGVVLLAVRLYFLPYVVVASRERAQPLPHCTHVVVPKERVKF